MVDLKLSDAGGRRLLSGRMAEADATWRRHTLVCGPWQEAILKRTETPNATGAGACVMLSSCLYAPVPNESSTSPRAARSSLNAQTNTTAIAISATAVITPRTHPIHESLRLTAVFQRSRSKPPGRDVSPTTRALGKAVVATSPATSSATAAACWGVLPGSGPRCGVEAEVDSVGGIGRRRRKSDSSRSRTLASSERMPNAGATSPRSHRRTDEDERPTAEAS